MESHGANSLGFYLLLLPFCFVTVFASFFPWSIKLPSLIRKLWRSRDIIDTYLLTGTAIIFVIFSLIKTKLPHYTLPARSEEHTSELQSLTNLVCRLLLEKKNKKKK